MGQIEVHHKEVVHQGRVFDFTKEKVTLSNGVTVDMEVIRHPGAAAIVPLTTDGEVVMLEQYRHAVGGSLWEIPAGTMDPGDPSPIDCARRELVEETGFSAATWDLLGELTPVPGYSDERIHLFLARDLAPATQDLDADEIVSVTRLPLAEVRRMVFDGRITDAKTIAGIFMIERHVGIHLT
jgi:ADP-ribose pyrophosphatase